MKLQQLREVTKLAVNPDPNITQWLRKVGYVGNYVLKDKKIILTSNTSKIDIDGKNLKDKDLIYSFGGSIHRFSAKDNQLSSFKSFPEEITDELNIEINKFKSFEGIPIIGGDLYASNNLISSFKWLPDEINGFLGLSINQLESFEFCPKKINGTFFVGRNKLTSFENAPSFIKNSFSISHNMLTSLKDIHKHVKHIGGWLDVSGNPITSNILGVILIDGLRSLDVSSASSTSPASDDLYNAAKIVNKHLGKGKQGVLDAQQELIENDLEDFAEL